MIASIAEHRQDDFPEIPSPELLLDEFELERAAPATVRKLLALPWEQRLIYIVNSPAVACSQPVIELLIKESHRFHSTDSTRAVEIAEVASLCADVMAPERYGPSIAEDALRLDLQARALAELAEAHRRDANLKAAADAIEEAEAAFELGSQDVAIFQVLKQNKGQLAMDQGHMQLALVCFDQAVKACLAADQLHLCGRALCDRSTAFARLGRVHDAITDLHRAANYLDYRLQPRMGFVVSHNLALRYEEAGFLDRALTFLRAADRKWSHVMNDGDRIRNAWARGRVRAAQGDLEAARAHFVSARDGFLTLNHYLAAATVELDLALVLGKEDRFGEVKRLATEMLAVFRTVGVPREAESAYYLLQTATSLRTVREAAAIFSRAKSSGPPSQSPAPSS